MVAQSDTIRGACEALIEDFLAFLDADDGDPDLEDGHDAEDDRADDEPSIGATDALNQERAWATPTGFVWDVDRERDDADNEPSLGSVAVHELISQQAWAAAGQGSDDAEGDEHDGAEPDEDGEPSLGATVTVNQEHAWRNEVTGFYWGEECEPNLGSPERIVDQRRWSVGSQADDREEDPAELGVADYDAMISLFD